MMEYKILREVDSGQSLWSPETARDRLEKTLNELADAGWIVRSFSVNPLGAGSPFVLRPPSFAYVVLLEREKKERGQG
jgi:hypothetical protein